MNIYFAVDRIEGRFAVIEYQGQFYDVPRGSLKAGQVYRWSGQRWVRDKAEERRRLAESRGILERLKASDPGGNIRL